VNWSAQAFAEHAGMSLAFLHRLESAEHKGLSLLTLERLGKALGVDPACLVAPSSAEKHPFSGRSIRAAVAASVLAARKHRGWTQQALAKASGVNRSVIADLERQARNASIDVLRRLADALELPLPVLLTGL
jgi:transcriptional regulator with XRE-family HTH domain